MKTYEQALAKIQETVDEERACKRERKLLIDRDLEVELGSAEDAQLEKELGYLNWKIQSLEHRIPAFLAMLRFIYEEDGRDIYRDIDSLLSE